VRSWPTVLLAVALTAPALGGCGGSGSGIQDASAADNRAADERLQGRWRVIDFRPATPLDPSMATMLGQVQPTLQLEVRQGRMRALGTNTVHFDRRYVIQDALGNRFTLVVYDDLGVGQPTFCTFQLDGSLVARTTSPWHGTAILARAH
jgi:hypothetical protein